MPISNHPGTYILIRFHLHTHTHTHTGFWPESQRSDEFRGWFALQGNVTDGLPKNCKYRLTNVSRCLFPEHFADEIETRLFPQQVGTVLDLVQCTVLDLVPTVQYPLCVQCTVQY